MFRFFVITALFLVAAVIILFASYISYISWNYWKYRHIPSPKRSRYEVIIYKDPVRDLILC